MRKKRLPGRVAAFGADVGLIGFGVYLIATGEPFVGILFASFFGFILVGEAFFFFANRGKVESAALVWAIAFPFALGTWVLVPSLRSFGGGDVPLDALGVGLGLASIAFGLWLVTRWLRHNRRTG